MKLLKSTRLRKWIVRSVLFVVAFSVISWIGAAMMASSNQKKIDQFMSEVGGQDLMAFAMGNHQVQVGPENNGWYLIQGALALVPAGIREVESEDLTANAISKREECLDKSHLSIELALQCERITAILNYEDHFSMLMPHISIIKKQVELTVQSAIWNIDQGNPTKAGERYMDALHLAHHGTGEPVMISFLVEIACHDLIIKGLESRLDQLEKHQLIKIRDFYNTLNANTRLRRAMQGEMFFGLNAWDELSGKPSKLNDLGIQVGPVFSIVNWVPGFSLYWEYDKSEYLDLMLPAIKQDANFHYFKNLNFEEEISSFAILTRMLGPALSSVAEKAGEFQTWQVSLTEKIDDELLNR